MLVHTTTLPGVCVLAGTDWYRLSCFFFSCSFCDGLPPPLPHLSLIHRCNYGTYLSTPPRGQQRNYVSTPSSIFNGVGTSLAVVVFFYPLVVAYKYTSGFFWDSQVSFRLRWINNGVAYKWVFPLEAMLEITNIGWLTFARLIRSVGTWFWARSMRRHFSNEEHKYWKRRLRPELWVKSVAPRAVALDYGSTRLADDVEMRSVPE